MTHHPEAYYPPSWSEQQAELADRAFDRALAAGRLSENPASPLYAGLYMFMGYGQPKPGYVLGKALFKHVDTRKYLP